MIEVVSVGTHAVASPDPEGMQVWMIVEVVEPGAVDVDNDSVVNELWAVLTMFVVRVGISIHVWDMLEQFLPLVKF